MNFGSDRYLMPPLTLAERATEESDAGRFLRYRQYLDFYNGAQWAEKRRPGERRLTVNYARTVCQKATSYLMGKPLKVELLPAGEDRAAQATAQRVEQALAGMWDDNDLALLDYDAALDASILGDCAFKVTVQEGGLLPSRLEAGPGRAEGAGRVVVRPVEVMHLRAGWRGDDLRRLRWVSEEYRITAGEARERFGARSLGQLGQPRRKLPDSQEIGVRERWSDTRWSLEVAGEELRSGPNPYGFVPYVIIPNLSRPRYLWGQSDLEDLMTLNSELNVRVSVLSQLLQMSGSPVLVLENVESAENIRVGPGAVWSLPEGSHAGILELLKEGGVDLHIKYIELLYRMLHDLSEAPGAGFGRDEAGSTASGVALEIMLHPVLQRVQRKRRIWDAALDLRNRMMLALAGLPVHRSRIIWPEVLPRDRSALVTQEVGLVAAGIHSLQTARRNLGDEQPAQEDGLIVGEREVRAALGQEGGVTGPVRLSGALVDGLSRA